MSKDVRAGLTLDSTSLWQMTGYIKRTRTIDPADVYIIRDSGLEEHFAPRKAISVSSNLDRIIDRAIIKLSNLSCIDKYYIIML